MYVACEIEKKEEEEEAKVRDFSFFQSYSFRHHP